MIRNQIEKYTIISHLGRGGMASVYLAHDNKFDSNVAVKVLNKEFMHNENIRKRFLAEAKNMFKMSHPNIIKVTDLIEEEDTVAFVMEHIEGETLKEYLDRKGKLSDEEIKNFFAQMLEAVGYVHKQQLVHRDIKPSNFMIDREGKVKLMDFGIAKTLDASSAEYTQTGTGVQMGTPMYMSPEQITETKSVTAQTDIYSLGVILWQMVTGQKPYNTNTLSSFQLQTKIVNEPLDNTNSNWDDLIQKATTKDIASRYISTNAFKMTLESKNDKKLIESDSTIIDSAIKQAPSISAKPEPSSSLEAKANIEKALGSEKVHLELSKKNYLPLIIIAALCITALVIYLVSNPGSSSTYEEAATAEAATIAAVDTFTFSQVKIGDQVWMTENLDVDVFRNGDLIREAKTNDEWETASNNREPAWCYYDNNPSNGTKYGKLYNWYAVNDPRGLAPEGWHIPSEREWKVLNNYLGGEEVAGKKMKSSSGWAENGNGTNESGFSGLPGGGHVGNTGIFWGIGNESNWWSSTNAVGNFLIENYAFYSYMNWVFNANKILCEAKGDGLSVRCLKN